MLKYFWNTYNIQVVLIYIQLLSNYSQLQQTFPKYLLPAAPPPSYIALGAWQLVHIIAVCYNVLKSHDHILLCILLEKDIHIWLLAKNIHFTQ